MVEIIPATALEVIRDAIDAQSTDGKTYIANAPSAATGIVREIVDDESPSPHLTFGTIVALEPWRVSIGVRGNPRDYATPRNEALRIRYLVASLNNYTSRGLRLLVALPVGGLRSIGQDSSEREQFSLLFDVIMEPSYVQ